MREMIFTLITAFTIFACTSSSKTVLKSTSSGTVSKGTLDNGAKLKYKGDNYKYFSLFSYIVLNRAYTNQKVKSTLEGAFKDLKTSTPKRKYRIMECSNRKGGKMWPHRTHQNGLSVDLMVPLSRNNKPYYTYDKLGVFHYLLKSDNTGHFDKHVKIDFEALGKMILAVEKNARLHGMKIKKVLLKTQLKDELYATASGKKIKKKGIYFAQYLTPVINNLHDDHIHIDFEKL